MRGRPASATADERRWLAVALPLFPIELARRELRSEPGSHRAGPSAPGASRGLAARPLALVERKGGSLYVRAASLEALAAGVRPGSTHAQALAAAPDLVVRERREDEEREALLALARWAAFTIAPRPSVEPARHAVLVDVTGTALVHGTEEALVARVLDELRSFGHEARAAIAATPLAALALADAGTLEARRPWILAEPGATRRALLPLPPRALGLAPDALDRLVDLGIRTVGELLRLPRASLPVRFGPDLVLALERALGERPHGLEPARFSEEVRERLAFDDDGTDRLEDVMAAVEVVAQRVLARLAAEGRAPRALELSFARERAPADAFPLRLAAPVGTLAGLLSLLRDRLERLDLARAVVAVELRVTEAARRLERQGLLFSARDVVSGEASGAARGLAADTDLALLLARLEGRLGARRVVRAELIADHRPERAFVYRPVIDARASAAGASLSPRPKKPRAPAKSRVPPPRGPRPARLLARPVPLDVTAPAGVPRALVHRGRERRVVRARGPERLETGFWDGQEIRRDYWILADETGREVWAFRDLASGRWFLHGLYD